MDLRTAQFRECCFKTLPADGLKLVWEITHHCTFGCSYCFQAKKRNENRIRVLHPTDFRTIITRMPQLGVSDVLLTGGEVRWVKDALPDICDLLTNESITYSLSTNYIHDRDFIDFLLQLRPRALNISWDPRTTETQDANRRLSDRVRHVLLRCQQEDIPLKATGVVTSESLPHLREYLAEASQFASDFSSLSSVYVTYPHDIGYVKANVGPGEDILRRTLSEVTISEALRERVRFVNFHRFNAPLQGCPAGKQVAHLEPNGNIYPCHLLANLPQETFLMGNLLTDPPAELLFRLQDFGRRTTEAVEDYKAIDECRKCRVAKECGGGCIAEVVSIGKLIEPQLVCKKIKPRPKPALFELGAPALPLVSSPIADLSQLEEQKIASNIQQNLRKGHDLAHGFDHVSCVVRYARHIARKEGANLRIVTAAAYFHDFEPRRKLIYAQHTEYSAQQPPRF